MSYTKTKNKHKVSGKTKSTAPHKRALMGIFLLLLLKITAIDIFSFNLNYFCIIQHMVKLHSKNICCCDNFCGRVVTAKKASLFSSLYYSILFDSIYTAFAVINWVIKICCVILYLTCLSALLRQINTIALLLRFSNPRRGSSSTLIPLVHIIVIYARPI